jgi:hypothetical protein
MTPALMALMACVAVPKSGSNLEYDAVEEEIIFFIIKSPLNWIGM